MSPYFGIEADLAYKHSAYTNSDPDNQLQKVSGAWSQGGFNQGFFRMGANALMGMDFYVAKNIYLGTEIGYGFQFIKYSDIKTTTANSMNNQEFEGGSNSQFGPNFLGAIRLGFIF